MFTVVLRFVRRLIALLLITAGCSGCLGRLIADMGMSEADRVECDALVQAVTSVFKVSHFRFPPGLSRVIGTKALEGEFPRNDLWIEEEPPAIGCRTEVRGVFLTLYTVVKLWRVTDPKDQEAIVALVRQRHRELAEAKPTLGRFFEREIWLVHRNIRGEANGYGRGDERVLRREVIR